MLVFQKSPVGLNSFLMYKRSLYQEICIAADQVSGNNLQINASELVRKDI